MFTKLLRPCLLALPLLATSCSIGPGDYVIYRVAFSAVQNAPDCGMPGPDEAEDTTSFTTPTSMALFAFEDTYFLEFGDPGMGGITGLEGTRDGNLFTFNGTSVDVTEIDPSDGSKTRVEFSLEVTASIKGKNLEGFAVSSTNSTCSGDACPDDVYPFSCTTETRFRGSQIDGTDIERPI